MKRNVLFTAGWFVGLFQGARDLGVMFLTDKELERLDTMEKAVKTNTEKVGNAIDQAMAEVKRLETLTGKTNDELKAVCAEAKQFNEKNGQEFITLKNRLQDIEQKLDKKPQLTEEEQKAMKSPGQIVVESDEWKAAAKVNEMKEVDVGAFLTKNFITNVGNQTTNTIGILTPNDRVAGIIRPADRMLTLRALLPVIRTSSPIIEYASENVFTNNAASQGATASPPAQEGEPKAQSNITFTYAQKPVQTIAHFMAASRQVLSDAPMLQDYVDGRLRHGAALEEEDQIINGDGTGFQLSGLASNATAYNQSKTGDTRLDTILRAMHQVALSEYAADSLVLSKGDWVELMLLKDTQGRYLFGDPASMTQRQSIWGLPYVATNSMSAGKFFVANFGLAAALFDRENTTVRISEHHENFFVRNLVAILCEMRVALVVFRSAAIIYGTFPA